MISGVATPATHTPNSANALIIIAVCVHSRMRLRGKRSASDPASGLTSSAGKNAMNAPMPSHAADFVSWYSTYGAAIACIHVPLLETSAALQKIA